MSGVGDGLTSPRGLTPLGDPRVTRTIESPTDIRD